MSNEKEKKITESDAFVPVRQSERQPWWNISLIWAGSSICVPTIMVGASMIEGLTFAQMMISIVVGSAILLFIMCLQGMQGTDTGLPTVINARSAFGKEGSGYLISFVLALTLVGWAGTDCQVAGDSLGQIMQLYGIEVNQTVVTIVLGLIMLTVAILGEKVLAKLNMIGVPALVILCVYGIWYSTRTESVSSVLSAEPSEPMGLFNGITLVVGMFTVAAVTAPDYHRFVKTRKQSCAAAIVGILPFSMFLYVSGAIMGKVAATSDITVLVAQLGMPVLGLIILIIATWTTMAADAYIGGMAITNLLHLSGTKRGMATAIAGIAGILLAVFGIMDYFTNFLNIIASAIPPIAGVMIADYWIRRKGKVENWKEEPGVNWIGIASWILGVVVALFVPVGISGINGIITAFVLFLLGSAIIKK